MIGEDIYTAIILLVSSLIFLVMITNIVGNYIFSGNVYMAVAGSYKTGTQKLRSWEDMIGKCRLEDDKHRIIDSRNYRAYMASGQSMLLCGINDGDLLLTEKMPHIHNEQITPCILVLKREEYKQKEARERGDNAIYKIRRTWAKCEITDKEEDLLLIAKRIMERDDFKKVMEKAREKNAYTSDNIMLDRLKKSYNDYLMEHKGCIHKHNKNHEVLISTTLYVEDNEVRFSIHPARIAEGKVVYAYNLNTVGETRAA